MNNDIKSKTITGSFWSMVDNIAGSGINFLVGIILARLLSPDDFGLIGMITIFIAIFETIVDSGFSSALVQKKICDKEDYSTVFYFNLVFGIILYLVFFATSPLIGDFFNQPLLKDITRVLALNLIIDAVSIIQRTIITKRVDFKTLAIISFVSSVMSGIIGILMAYKGFGVWSLVFQRISRQTIISILLWILGKWRPILAFSISKFKSLFSFGGKILAANLIGTVWNNLYYVVIGKFYSPTTLGYYTQANQYQNILSSNLTGVIQRVSFPILSSIQDEKETLRLYFKKLIRVMSFLTFSMMFLLLAVSKNLIIVLIGEKWIPAAYFLQVLCLSSFLYPIQAINLNIINVSGRSDLYLKLEIIKKSIYLIPVILGITIGIDWMLWGSVAASFIAFFLNSGYSGSLIGYSTKDQIKDILPFLAISVVTCGVVLSVSLFSLPPIITLSIQLLLGVALYYVLYRLFKIQELYDGFNIVKEYFYQIFVRKNK